MPTGRLSRHATPLLLWVIQSFTKTPSSPLTFVLYFVSCHLLTHVASEVIQMMSEMWCVHQKEFIFPNLPPVSFIPVSQVSILLIFWSCKVTTSFNRMTSPFLLPQPLPPTFVTTMFLSLFQTSSKQNFWKVLLVWTHETTSSSLFFQNYHSGYLMLISYSVTKLLTYHICS